MRTATSCDEVRVEDEPALVDGGLDFNSNAILAGRFPGDSDPVLMHVYPEGNWVEATDDAPYFVIGRSSYGKPILDRLLTFTSTLEQAISLAYLAFDATSASATDVDFPIDIGVQPRDQETFTMQRFTRDDMTEVHAVAEPPPNGARRTSHPVGRPRQNKGPHMNDLVISSRFRYEVDRAHVVRLLDRGRANDASDRDAGRRSTSRRRVAWTMVPYGSGTHQLLRLTVDPCELDLSYTASVTVTPQSDRPSGSTRSPFDEVPADVLPYLNPSRYCESDKLGNFSLRVFGDTSARLRPGDGDQ